MKLKETERLLKVVHELRTQCPWDKKQTHKTLTPYLIEEAHEAVEAIQGSKKKEMCEELGDVLLQVALHAEIANEKKAFDFEKIAKNIADKMIRRHPHIYAKAEVKDYKSHMKNWQKLKAEEKPKKTALAGIPKSLPSLQRAQRYGEIAAQVGFDWEDPKGVSKKLSEELGELKAALRSQNQDHIREELGDVLFTLAQLSRHLKIDAEGALRESNDKFLGRFEAMEKLAKKKKLVLSDMDTEALEALWQKIK